jgi:hypothetical protein
MIDRPLSPFYIERSVVLSLRRNIVNGLQSTSALDPLLIELELRIATALIEAFERLSTHYRDVVIWHLRAYPWAAEKLGCTDSSFIPVL